MFSELVDNCIRRSGRGDKLTDIIAYANATIRESQAENLFFKDLIEDKVYVTNTDPLIWTPPKPIFRQLRTVQYPDLSYPPLRKPGRVQHSDSVPGDTGYELGEKYYYAASDYIVFTRCGTTGDVQDGFTTDYIGVAYYTWLPRLKYYTVGHRPATFSDELASIGTAGSGADLSDLGWSYFNLTGDTDSTTSNVRYDFTTANAAWQLPTMDPPMGKKLVANWMLIDWNEMVQEGTLAKLYKAINDNTRAQTSFLLYKTMQEKLKSTEIQESLEK